MHDMRPYLLGFCVEEVAIFPLQVHSDKLEAQISFLFVQQPSIVSVASKDTIFPLSQKLISGTGCLTSIFMQYQVEQKS